MLLRMRALVAIALWWFCGFGSGQARTQNWHTLVHAGKYTQAETLCTKMTSAEALATRVDAEKCLANVALGRGSRIEVLGAPGGGGSIGEGYSPVAAQEALVHLNRGLALAPQDLSIHQGRLHVLEVTGQYGAMLKAIDESATVYQGPDALQSWLAYDGELAEKGEYDTGLSFAEVLNRHYPNSHDVVGNIGAFLSRKGDFEKALPYLKQAAELAPKDPIDTWNLGWGVRQARPAERRGSVADRIAEARWGQPGCGRPQVLVRQVHAGKAEAAGQGLRPDKSKLRAWRPGRMRGEVAAATLIDLA